MYLFYFEMSQISYDCKQTAPAARQPPGYVALVLELKRKNIHMKFEKLIPSLEFPNDY